MSKDLAGLRRARPGDAPAVSALMQTAFAPYLPRMDRPPAPMLRDYGQLTPGEALYVLPGARDLRAAILLRWHLDFLELDTLAVTPSAQGAGLGRALIAWAEQQGVAAKRGWLRLQTNQVMQENAALYQRLGFAITGTAQTGGYHRICFEKPLPQPGP